MADFVGTFYEPGIYGWTIYSPEGIRFFVSGGGGILSPFELVGAAQFALNSIDLGFSLEPAARNDGAPGDALTVSAYTLTAVDPASAVVPRIIWAERVGPGVIRLYTDAVLDADAEYMVTVTGVVSAEGAYTLLPGSTEATLHTFARGTPPPAQPIAGEVRTDLRNAPGEGALTGALEYDETGDLANESGTAYLRKRILRRLTTARGGFFHLPDYGVGLTKQLKRLITEDLVRRMRSRIAAQVRAEPGVIEAKVSIRRRATSILDVSIQVRDDSGALLPEIRATVDLDTEE